MAAKSGQKGQFAKGNPGKPKGAVSHLTRTVKEVVLKTFNDLQDDEKNNLLAFAQKFPRDFYNIAAKLIPTELSATVTNLPNLIEPGEDE